MSKGIDPARQATDQARGETQEVGARSLPLQPIDWKQEVSNGLSWLDGRAWSVGGFLLFLSVLCLHHYATQTGASLSVTSGNLIASLPSMLALVIFAAVMLVLGLMMPTVVLFTPLKKGGPLLFDLLTRKRRRKKGRRQREGGSAVRLKGWFVTAWIVAPLATGGSLLACLSLLPPNLLLDTWISWLIVVVFVGVFIVCMVWLLKHLQRTLKLPDISSDMWFTVVLAAVVQLGWVILIMDVGGKLASYRGLDDLAYVVVILMFGVFSLALFQLSGAVFFGYVRNQSNPVQYVAVAAAIMVSLMIIFPPVGGALAAYAIQMPASAGQGCSVLIWSPAAGEEVQALRDEKDPTFSKPLRILLDDGDRYQVRLREKTEGVRFVPRASVMGFDPCTKP